MNGIQIEHILNVIEEKSDQNRAVVRQEIAIYLREHMQDVANDIASKGVARIPTTLGEIEITMKDLNLLAV
ncbi:hypothetical protein [Granulicella sp. S156]|uniref:hypothetical protein n=1 Tax=Granulicella sp. S156 TaxID=1747224 RepID=UPI00131D6432|nr:hypothetical protein [Granulicella sp. S156]